MPNPSKFKALVSRVLDHGDGIYTVDFELENGLARFKPGQFLHLTVDEFDPASGFWPESRVFSIASNPGQKNVQIVYSVKGFYTKKMSEKLKEGFELWLKLPYGDFIIENFIKEDDRIFIIAGGTGISPFIPFLRDFQKKDINADINLYYGIRNEKFYLYKDFILGLDKININIIEGMMDVDAICQNICKEKKSKYFISGPPEMINSFKNKLKFFKVDTENIITDDWE